MIIDFTIKDLAIEEARQQSIRLRMTIHVIYCHESNKFFVMDYLEIRHWEELIASYNNGNVVTR